jgi:hypothetical protein
MIVRLGYGNPRIEHALAQDEKLLETLLDAMRRML